MPVGEIAPTGARSARPGESRLRLGVSACLLGEHVRWDGGE